MELPRLEPLYRTYRARGLQIIAVDGRRDRERATKFIAENKLTYPCLENGEGDAAFVYETFQVGSYPTSFLIDGQGRILFTHLGFAEGDEEKLAAEIERVLGL
ncbi:TlpA family protein disulfide reductase [bacterium]|nr:TlpA family protein disulfide reductase [bacterium]